MINTLQLLTPMKIKMWLLFPCQDVTGSQGSKYVDYGVTQDHLNITLISTRSFTDNEENSESFEDI